MRVLVATTAGAGHFGPLVPFARSCREAGHQVAVAAPRSFAPVVERAGFTHLPFSDVPEEELRAVFETLPGLSNEEANAVVMGEVFGRIDARAALPGVDAAVREWRPDAIVREMAEFASYVVAEAHGIPHAQVAVTLASFEERALRVLEGPLTELGATPGLARLTAAPRFTLAPARLEDPAAPGRAGTTRFREAPGDGRLEPLPDWWDGSREPLVYVSFGTVAAAVGLFPDLYREVIAALADLRVRVLLTVGHAGDPEELGAVPAHVHVETWFPQRQAMTSAAAMVGHGGFGTTLSGLAAGVPMVVVPLFADQPLNARRVEAIGAGVALHDGRAGVASLGRAVAQVLEDKSYRTSARLVAAEVAELPPTSEAVPLLEELAG